MEIPVGTSFSVSEPVTYERTARVVGSGGLEVYATPAMASLIEKAAFRAIEPFLEDGKTSVGTLLNLKHVASTPVGGTVRAEAVVTETDGRRVVFSVKAFDGAGLIGEGTHERFIVAAERFMEKSKKRAEEA